MAKGSPHACPSPANLLVSLYTLTSSSPLQGPTLKMQNRCCQKMPVFHLLALPKNLFPRLSPGGLVHPRRRTSSTRTGGTIESEARLHSTLECSRHHRAAMDVKIETFGAGCDKRCSICPCPQQKLNAITRGGVLKTVLRYGCVEYFSVPICGLFNQFASLAVLSILACRCVDYPASSTEEHECVGGMLTVTFHVTTF